MNEYRREILKALVAASAAASANAAPPNPARVVHRQPLPPPFDGLDAAFVEVEIAPGPGSAPHRHSGFVLGYVLDGEFRFGTDGQTPQTLKRGETFYEPPGAVHSISASAHPTKSARILAIIIGEKGKELTTYER